MRKVIIDTKFNFYTDTKGVDPDNPVNGSPTLKKYHKTLWSKALPNGELFRLSDNPKAKYLYHKSSLGEFYLGSDAITHSYKNQKRKKDLISSVKKESEELFDFGSCIASYIIFPDRQINRKPTINQARGVNHFIDDRFDLTLECIRRFYKGESSPLFNTLLKYKNFFDLFESFENYVEYFLLQDLIDNKSKSIKFYLPFDDFKSPPEFHSVEDYLIYKSRVLEFNQKRKLRISPTC